MNEETIENRNEAEARPETHVEKQTEQESNLIKGAEMLEEPPNGSFTQGLQVFVAWVKSLVASNKDK